MVIGLRSLRANLVLRWEYRPGSTVYLAWAHGRDDQRNRLVLKLSYWFNT